jgi:MYXO-CTERM domain-containing protein
MKYIARGLLLGCGLVGGLVGFNGTASAHFELVSPKSAFSGTNGGKGGPPCPKGTATNMVTEVKGGSTLMITINETVYHPGHYRVAIANDVKLLPVDAEVQKKGNGESISATIDPAPKLPVLKDGALVHTAKFNGMQTIEVQVPDMDCPSCTLSVAEFMAEHGAPYYYHQCATLKITASGGGGTTDAGSPDTATGTGGSAGTGGTTGTGGNAAAGGSSGAGSGGSAATGGSSGSGSGGTAATGGSSGSGSGGSSAKSGGSSGSTGGSSGSPSGDGGGSGGGCSVGGGSPSAAGFGLLALVGLLLRRRRR